MTLGLIWRRPGELPLEVTGFVGRQRELAGLTTLLRTARLVTATGPGGVGKTRVALRAAVRAEGQFADGVCLAELGGLRDPALLPLTVATCLGLPEPDARSGAQAIVDYLRDRELLLILDTCEHLIGACADLIGTVLRHAPGVTVLATSRQPLDLPGEHPYPIPPLPVPGSDAAPASRGDAVELFAQRAAAADPGFAVTAANRADVIRLCRRLDGIPLAIELATVQLRAVPLHQLTGRLERRFLQLTGGRRVTLPHHQTLRATTQWSFDLCSPAEQLLWTRLSVFAGTFDIPAAEAVCAGGPLAREDVLPTLIGLVDKSVVLRAEEDGGGYRLLDTIAEFGAELLAAPASKPGCRTGTSVISAPWPPASVTWPRATTSWTGTGSCAGSTRTSGPPSATRSPCQITPPKPPRWQPTCAPTGRSPACCARDATGWARSCCSSPRRRRSGPGC